MGQRYWISAIVGALFLVIAASRLIWARQSAGPPGWIDELEACTPRIALIAGVVVALINPNLVILLSGSRRSVPPASRRARRSWRF